LQNFRQPDARDAQRRDQNRAAAAAAVSGLPPVARGCGARGGDPASSSTWSMLLYTTDKSTGGAEQSTILHDVGIIDERARATED
jgi:hypothetical protein